MGGIATSDVDIGKDSVFKDSFAHIGTHVSSWLVQYLHIEPLQKYRKLQDGSVGGIATNDVGIGKDNTPKDSFARYR